jgi:alkanesulfonate monooxygenase SsuD/methylene tetrahydromethanopterin reductase-like flavin-dependent oxidoreductase (luciferase family)
MFVEKGAGREGRMEFGVHLPLLAFREHTFSLTEQLGFTTLCANDHLIGSRPWLDSLTALASVLAHTHQVTLMTTAALPVVRGPVPLAKALAALDVLSGGRLVVGVSSGSSPQDYALVGIAFEERWKRFDEAVQVLRCLLRTDAPPFHGQFYAADQTRLEPFPAQESGLPIWIGSWGSDAGLRRVARLGDGWLASAYNITPESFADGLVRLHVFLRQVGKEPDDFPHALGSMFFHLTDDRRRAEEMLGGLLSPILGRPIELLRERLLVGTPNECAEKLTRLKAAGVRKVFLWPVTDDVDQLAKFHDHVFPQLPV